MVHTDKQNPHDEYNKQDQQIKWRNNKRKNITLVQLYIYHGPCQTGHIFVNKSETFMLYTVFSVKVQITLYGAIRIPVWGSSFSGRIIISQSWAL